MISLELIAAVFQMLAMATICIICLKWALEAVKESNEYAERTKKSRWDD